MRLSVEFDKNTDGNISVCIKVINQQSYKEVMQYKKGKIR